MIKFVMTTGRVAAVLALALWATGCATTEVGTVRAFAAAGEAYTHAVEELVSVARKVSVDADSAILTLNRQRIAEPERHSTYTAHTKALTAQLQTLHQVSRHTQVLADYFKALSALAGEELGAEPAAAAAATELQKLSSALGGATIADKTVRNVVEAATELTVRHQQRRALNAELERRAKIIEQELALQAALVELLTRKVAADLKTIADVRGYTEVAAVYAGDGRLPSRWSTNRRQALLPVLTPAAAAQATAASQRLHDAFVRLVADDLPPGEVAVLFADINRLLDVAALVREAVSTGEKP